MVSHVVKIAMKSTSLSRFVSPINCEIISRYYPGQTIFSNLAEILQDSRKATPSYEIIEESRQILQESYYKILNGGRALRFLQESV